VCSLAVVKGPFLRAFPARFKRIGWPAHTGNKQNEKIFKGGLAVRIFIAGILFQEVVHGVRKLSDIEWKEVLGYGDSFENPNIHIMKTALSNC
jgi:hypothetical protein